LLKPFLPQIGNAVNVNLNVFHVPEYQQVHTALTGLRFVPSVTLFS